MGGVALLGNLLILSDLFSKNFKSFFKGFYFHFVVIEFQLILFLIRILNSKKFKKTVTLDNGFENTDWQGIEQRTGLDCYHAHAYHSWERGTNENTNMLIRDFFPKGTDFNTIPSGKIKHVQELLNNRPRKTLDWSTPNEMFNEYILRGKAGIAYTKNVI